MPETPQASHRPIAFFLLCAVVAGMVAGYVAWRRTPPSADGPAAVVPVDRAALTAAMRQPFLLFRNTDLGPQHGVVFLSPSGEPDRRYATPLNCERVHYAAGHGVCLVAARGATTRYRAITFDDAFNEQHSLALAGVPSRVRVSPDGRRAGITVFVTGDSYATPGNFSTRSAIVDLQTGAELSQLEDYAITRDGQRFKEVDFNFWGVTFADQRRFYATLGTAGRTFLVSADADARTGHVVHEGVECPSLSPDGRRIAFKKRETKDSRLIYRITVLDVATAQVLSLTEARSVDDQVEWIDDSTIVYGLPEESRPGSTTLWTVAADGRGTPRRLADGWSPAAVRP